MLRKLYIATILLIIGFWVGLIVFLIQNVSLAFLPSNVLIKAVIIILGIAVGIVLLGIGSMALFVAVTNLIERIWYRIYTVSNEQQRYLTFGSVLFKQNEESCRTLKLGQVSKRQAKAMLRDWWDIEDRSETMYIAQTLSDAERHTLFADDVYHNLIKQGRLKSLTSDDLQNLKEENASQIDRINDGLENYKLAKELLIKLGYTESELSAISSTAAWDLGRAGFIARYGAYIGYIKNEEAWQYMKAAAENAVKIYASWREYLAAYILGRSIGYCDAPVEYYSLFEELLNDPKSSFNENPFQ